jgi:hypothetical protein
MTTVTAAAASQRSNFYVWSEVAMMITAFVGFAPTFWLPMATQGVPERIVVIAFHATLFYSWTLLFLYQTWLVAGGRVERHRNVGLLGVSLATAMVIFGVLAAINAAQRADAANYAAAGESFMIVPISALFIFAVLVTAALANTGRSEWHKRLMLSASAVLLDAAIARPFLTYVVMGGHLPPFQGTTGLAGLHLPPPPVGGLLPPALAALLFIVAGMVRDWRVLGKVHPAYWWSGGFSLAVHLLKVPFSETAVWHAFARGLISLAG